MHTLLTLETVRSAQAAYERELRTRSGRPPLRERPPGRRPLGGRRPRATAARTLTMIATRIDREATRRAIA